MISQLDQFLARQDTTEQFWSGHSFFSMRILFGHSTFCNFKFLVSQFNYTGENLYKSLYSISNIPEFFELPWPCITITRCWKANLPELLLQAFSHPSHALQLAITHCPGHGRTHGSVSDGVQSHCFIGTSLFHLSRHFHTLTLDPELQFPTYGWHSPIDFKTGVKQFGSRHDLYWIKGSHSNSKKKIKWNSNKRLKYLYQVQYLARFFVVSVAENHIYNLC